MEARSKQHSNRCNATVLEQSVFIWFPTFQSDKPNSKKGSSRKGRANDNSYTNMVSTTLVSSSLRAVNSMPTIVTPLQDILLDPQGNNHRSKQETNVSCLEGYKKSLEIEGISSNVAKVISQSR